MSTSVAPPPLGIPSSEATVNVRIIDSTARVRVPKDMFLSPKISGHTHVNCPTFSFLVEHASGRRILFDLGGKKDWTNLAPVVVKQLTAVNATITIEKNVVEILEENGVKAESIEAIVWSHWHWDHTGDPSTFPPSTNLIVGPGFKDAFYPGAPANPECPILESAYTGRNLIELPLDDFKQKLGRFQALDYFGDGSFYLLSAPGHAIGHLCGLARTTTEPGTYVLMGADTAHHGGQFRPTPYLPLPSSILPNPLDFYSHTPCPGALFERIHPKRTTIAPFYGIAGDGVVHEIKEAREAIEKLEEFDGHTDQVFVIVAHDDTVLDIVDFFPKNLNAWKENGWAEKVRWRFLKDFKEAVSEQEKEGK
ncbi:MAG: hypothetical protein M1834_008901 [Cirrosporium novae-zelandiae]|nr:MAG: hypothetical protein M1834_008901 [Cirrosporium novae-zelandiae]